MATSDIDLSLVAPGRRDEIARRIAAIRKYLAAPSRQSAVEGAANLGLGLVTFYNLAAAWRKAPRPENLAGAGRPRQRRSTMSPEQIEVVDEAISIAPQLTHDGIVDLALKLASAAGVALPARNIVRRRIERTRPASIPKAAMANGADLLLDECVIDLPVESGGQVIRPLCSVLFDTRTLAPLGLHLTSSRPGAPVAAATLLDALERETVRQRDPQVAPLLDMHVGRDATWSTLLNSIEAQGVAISGRVLRDRGSGDAMMGVLGSTPGIRFMPRLLMEQDRSFKPRHRAPFPKIGDVAAQLRVRFGVDGTRATIPLQARGQRGSFVAALSAVAEEAPD